MRKVYQFISALTLGLVLSVVSVSADTTNTTVCDIYDTGTDSYNSCVTNVDSNVTISCQNDVYVVNDNSQSSSTGPAVVTDNSTSGNASSGNATNNNGTVQEIGSSCAPITTAAAPTTVTPTPAATTTPAPAKTATPAPVAAPVASLPNTGSDSAVKDASYVGIGAVALLAVSQIGLVVYRRLTL